VVPHFELYTDLAGEWRWRFVAANGRVMADSGEGYERKGDAEEAIETIKDLLDSDPPTFLASDKGTY